MADLRELLADPSRVLALSDREASELATLIATRQLELAALQGALAGRSRSPESVADPASDRLLTAEEVADRFRSTVRWVYRQAGKWPFTRRLGRKKLLFSEAGLNRYLAHRKP